MALPSVLLITFTLHLLLHILNHLIPDQLDAFLWQLFLRLPIPPAAQTATQTHNTPRLKQEIVRLQRDLSATSAQDDFARWARLRRELDRAKAKLDENSQTLASTRKTFDRATKALRFVGTHGTTFLCNFYFGKNAMFYLPVAWLPYPVEWVLSFPRAPLGGVSVNIWGMACAGVIGMGSEAIRGAGKGRGKGKVGAIGGGGGGGGRGGGKGEGKKEL